MKPLFLPILLAVSVGSALTSPSQTLVYSNQTIPGNSEIAGAGNAGLPDSSGVSPIEFDLPPYASVFTMISASGKITLNARGGSNDADGVIVSGNYVLSIPNASYAGPYGGLSGLKQPGAGAIAGVFEPAYAPTAAAPRHGESLGLIRFSRGVLEIHGPDAGGLGAGCALRLAHPAGDGGRSRAAVSESVAASEIHKAGQAGARAAKYLFYNILFGAGVFLAGQFGFFAPDHDFFFRVGQLGKSTLRLGSLGTRNVLTTGGTSTVAGPTVSTAFVGVGYIIGPELAALNFSGSVVAWGLLIPVLMYFTGPQLQAFLPAHPSDQNWLGLALSVWRFIVRPIAVGGMMVGTCYTLFRMRKNLLAGLAKAFAELRGGAPPMESVGRTERYMSSKTVFALIGVTFVLMCVLYIYMSGMIGGALAAALVMLIIGFFFATVSGYLVGVIGSTNNPISGLTLSTLVIAALLMVALGVSGTSGVVAVLAVAAVVCVSSAVAGELLQDFKVGYILGGTPRYIQIVELIAVVVASSIMYFPLLWLHLGNIHKGGIGFGDRELSAPQAGLMASLAQGIVGGDMAWPLVIAGILMGFAMILFKVKSPMLVAIGMYLPISITSAIFVGGLIRWVTDNLSPPRRLQRRPDRSRGERRACW